MDAPAPGGGNFPPARPPGLHDDLIPAKRIIYAAPNPSPTAASSTPPPPLPRSATARASAARPPLADTAPSAGRVPVSSPSSSSPALRTRPGPGPPSTAVAGTNSRSFPSTSTTHPNPDHTQGLLAAASLSDARKRTASALSTAEPAGKRQAPNVSSSSSSQPSLPLSTHSISSSPGFTFNPGSHILSSPTGGPEGGIVLGSSGIAPSSANNKKTVSARLDTFEEQLTLMSVNLAAVTTNFASLSRVLSSVMARLPINAFDGDQSNEPPSFDFNSIASGLPSGHVASTTAPFLPGSGSNAISVGPRGSSQAQSQHSTNLASAAAAALLSRDVQRGPISYRDVLTLSVQAVPNPDKDAVRSAMMQLRPPPRPNPANDIGHNFKAEANSGFRLVQVAGFDRKPIREVKQSLFTLNFQLSHIRNLSWIGANTLEFLVDKDYSRAFIRDIRRIPFLRQITDYDYLKSATSPSPSPEEVTAIWRRVKGRLLTETSESRREKAFFSELLVELEERLAAYVRPPSEPSTPTPNAQPSLAAGPSAGSASTPSDPAAPAQSTPHASSAASPDGVDPDLDPPSSPSFGPVSLGAPPTSRESLTSLSTRRSSSRLSGHPDDDGSQMDTN